MEVAEIILLISCLVGLVICCLVFFRLRLRQGEYACLQNQLKAKKAELNAAILRKVELLESQKAIEQTIDRGTYAVEQGHKLIHSLSLALVDIFADKKAPRNINHQRSQEIYDSIRRVNKQINKVAATILQEVPHGLMRRKKK